MVLVKIFATAAYSCWIRMCLCAWQRCYPPLTTHEWSGYWWVWWLLIALALLIFLLALILTIIICCLGLTWVLVIVDVFYWLLAISVIRRLFQGQILCEIDCVWREKCTFFVDFERLSVTQMDKSCHVRDRFMVVTSCYGVFWYPLQSVGVIKSAVWTSFAETLNRWLCFDFVFLCSVYCISYVGFRYRSSYVLCSFIISLCVLCLATLWCNNKWMNEWMNKWK